MHADAQRALDACQPLPVGHDRRTEFLKAPVSVVPQLVDGPLLVPDDGDNLLVDASVTDTETQDGPLLVPDDGDNGQRNGHDLNESLHGAYLSGSSPSTGCCVGAAASGMPMPRKPSMRASR